MSAEHEYNQQTLIMIRYACVLCMRVIYYIYKLYTCICVFYECEEKKQEVKKEKKKFHIMRFDWYYAFYRSDKILNIPIGNREVGISIRSS